MKIFEPITYDIKKIDQLIQDTQRRGEYFQKFSSILQQKIKIQIQYSNKLNQITQGYSMNNNHNKPAKPSEHLYQSLVQLVRKQSENHQRQAKQLQEQVCKRIRQQAPVIQKQNKKHLTIVKSLKKDIDMQLEALQKSKSKFYKRTSEVQKVKLQYISTILLQDRDFERKNKLFLKSKQLQSQIQPLKKSYQSQSYRYSQSLSTFTMKIFELLKKIQQRQISIVDLMRNSLINYQLFQLEYGEGLISQNQMEISHLSNICSENHQIKRLTQLDLDKLQQIYQNPYLNPSEYAEDLFRKIQDNTVEQAIKYGQTFQYKTQLSLYLENSHNHQKYKDLKIISDYTSRIVQIFKSIFEGKQYSNSMLIQFSQLIKAKSFLRKDFIFCLQKYRLDGNFEIHKNNFENIIELINIFLNICCSQLDTYNSKQFMVLSFTYYFIDQKQNKIDLQHFVKQHKIWQNLKWWQCSLLESIYQQHKLKLKKNQGTNAISLWDIKSSGIKRTDSDEGNTTIAYICFNQLAYYVHNMLLFDIKQTDIFTFAHKYIKILGINPKMTADIISMCTVSKHFSQ